MAQFDVYENPSLASRKTYPYLVDIQHAVLSDLVTRIVLPLATSVAFNNQAMATLTPEIAYDDETLLLMTPQVSTIRANLLGKPVGSLAHIRDEIIRSLAFAVSGF